MDNSINTTLFLLPIMLFCCVMRPLFHGLLWKPKWIFFSLRRYLDVLIMIAELNAAASLTVAQRLLRDTHLERACDICAQAVYY